jgi:hypothetical protein
LASTQPPLVCLDALSVKGNGPAGAKMRLTGKNALGEHELSIDHRLSFFRDHQSGFAMSGLAPHGGLDQAQPNDALSFQTEHQRISRECEPRVAARHRTISSGGEATPGRRRTLAALHMLQCNIEGNPAIRHGGVVKLPAVGLDQVCAHRPT